MSQTQEIDNIRHPRGRFSWVRRLMQGQRTNDIIREERMYHENYYKTSKTTRKPKKSVTINERRNNRTSTSRGLKSSKINKEVEEDSSEAEERGDGSSDARSYGASDARSYGASDVRSGTSEMTWNSDNVSTTPLKSIISSPSTNPPSVLSDNNNDTQSYNASTAETSIAPSSTAPFNLAFNRDRDSLPPPDRDSESIVTLASSTRRIRRRSLETNSSTVGIPPASIMERLSVQPTTANSAYANSLTANSLNPDDISYKDMESQSTSKST